MIQIIWEFVVHPDAARQFTALYGPDGEWAALFRRHPGFAGTTLLVPAIGQRFFTIDRWKSEADFEELKRAADVEYSALDTRGGKLTEHEARLGVFQTDRPFVVITGLPGSGKSTLARQLGPALALAVIDKDDLLEQLFDARGIGDAAWRRTLSRESDEMMKRDALVSTGAVLTSFWHLPGMRADSGTPTDWIPALSGRVVQIHCTCPAEVAAARFHSRMRHAGHLDAQKSLPDLQRECETLAHFPTPNLGRRLDVETSRTPALDDVVESVRHWLDREGIT